jgi:glycerol-3-phosphate dehydrogenase
VERILGTAAQAGDLGEQFGADLTAAEIAYLMDEEWAETAEDVLWRRSSLRLRLSATERATLDRFMTTRSRAGAKKEFH